MFSARVQRSAGLAMKEGSEPSAARSVREALASPSTELDPATRAFMEPRLGHDFSKVRIYAGEPAAGSALELSARTDVPAMAQSIILQMPAAKRPPRSLRRSRRLSKG